MLDSILNNEPSMDAGTGDHSTTAKKRPSKYFGGVAIEPRTVVVWTEYMEVASDDVIDRFRRPSHLRAGFPERTDELNRSRRTQVRRYPETDSAGEGGPTGVLGRQLDGNAHQDNGCHTNEGDMVARQETGEKIIR